jgi:hypothetical protein
MIFLLTVSLAVAQDAQEWFRDARFGMFIHWGVYSLLGKGEWVMENDGISVADYEKLPRRFNPIEYDPAEWVRIAKDAGVRYITITGTTTVRDGTRRSATTTSSNGLLRKDVLKALAEECRKAGISSSSTTPSWIGIIPTTTPRKTGDTRADRAGISTATSTT